MKLQYCLSCLAFVLICLGITSVASAQEKIGIAATVKNDVAQLRGAAPAPIVAGEDVQRNEVVRTGSDSNTKLVFVDDTNLAVGPASTVKLDKFVFADALTYNQAGMELAKGAFRFTTGHSEKRAYDIKTPVATIGVRGTILDVLSQGSKTTVVLHEGRAIVCPRRARADTSRKGCVELNNPGDTAVVTAGGAAIAPPGWTFACSADLCGVTTYASLVQPASFTDAALCGR